MARERRRSASLDQPYEPRRSVGRVAPDWDPDTFGRLSERISRFIGSWKFIAYMSAFIALWFGWNTLGPKDLRFDPYAFLFMTLLLSLQASYAAPLILLAQNRQADRDRVQYEQDRTRDERSIADTEYLVREVAALRIALGEVATRDFLRSELRDLLEELEESSREQDGPPGPSHALRRPATP
ncbi:MAG: DUF1003 domain-containing protein [Acidimicrobiales bacterium]